MMFTRFTNTQNAGMMPGDANSSPQCGRKAQITYNGKTVTGTLVDKCPGCVSPAPLTPLFFRMGYYHGGGNCANVESMQDGASIDLSHHLFQQLCDESVGRMKVTWAFLS